MGTLYASETVIGMLPRTLIEWLKIDIEPVNTSKKNEEFKNLFPLEKSPAFLGSHGFELTEVMAILYYLVRLKDDAELEKTFYGVTLEERSQVIRILSFTNQEITSSTVALVTATETNANQEEYEDKLSKCLACFAFLKQLLAQHEFLVKDQATVADSYTATICATLSGFALGKDKFDSFTTLNKWLSVVLQHSVLKGNADTAAFLEKTIPLPSAK
ncbi:LANO_0E00122g1_1 [Lachancea nothofagi CBS 11611]|uniref:LANO_0E00122g1_1 n=1 Tax=Lachancea nothofagi CBS 11611 TaxID=1266666 RepID=A0A1G4JNM9_9SACH|nr:LANO_0E00122g1_1 [Lachancea nothofagi CBS 11611]